MSVSRICQPTAIEFLDSINDSTHNSAGKISALSGDERKRSILFYGISADILRFSAILLHDSFVRAEYPD
jgi:hypothetical protein